MNALVRKRHEINGTFSFNYDKKWAGIGPTALEEAAKIKSRRMTAASLPLSFNTVRFLRRTVQNMGIVIPPVPLPFA